MHLTLILNCGSSSLKFALIEPLSSQAVLWGLAEKLFEATPLLSIQNSEVKQSFALAGQGHRPAIEGILSVLKERGLLGRVFSVGHRVVHGGERFKTATRITPEVIAEIEACIPLAPLHNPANLQGIRGAIAAFPDLPQVAVFDTAFHQTMPETAFRYAIPADLYIQHGVRRYGFHGTSHHYVTLKAAEMLGLEYSQANFISAHLGNGCSVAAVRGGKSVDTSMGLTPLEGLVMGTRSGDLDPGIFGFLADHLKLSLADINELLNKKSGLLGLSGLSNDMRELEAAASSGHSAAQLAIEVFCYRLAKYIAAMRVPLGHLDALIFTGGIGENSQLVRAKTLSWLGGLGFAVDAALNQRMARGQGGVISADGSPKAMVVNTNEEQMIAWETQKIIG